MNPTDPTASTSNPALQQLAQGLLQSHAASQVAATNPYSGVLSAVQSAVGAYLKNTQMAHQLQQQGTVAPPTGSQAPGIPAPMNTSPIQQQGLPQMGNIPIDTTSAPVGGVPTMGTG